MSTPPNRLAEAVEIAGGVAYIMVVGATLYLLFPGIRLSVKGAAAHFWWTWKYGKFVAERSPVVEWAKDAVFRGKVVDVPPGQG